MLNSFTYILAALLLLIVARAQSPRAVTNVVETYDVPQGCVKLSLPHPMAFREIYAKDPRLRLF